jgi:glucose/arabinose dehydrogenase/PKD repeat protein
MVPTFQRSAILLALASLAPAFVLSAPPSPFVRSTYITGLDNPTAMAFAPDGRLFVAEQNGKLRVIKNGTLLSAPFYTLPAKKDDERGFLGLAFDPSFATNGYVYVFYTVDLLTINRVSRLKADAARPDTALAGSETVILNNIPSIANWHNGGAIHFGQDGKLYIATGEGHDSANAQNKGSLAGKVLRINKDGTIPADNPFVGQAGARGEVWAMGFRNPFTFAADPGSTKIYVNDVGQASWEEVNALAKGANYGWPTCEGACADSRFKNPLYTYSHSVGQAITGAAFYRGSAFPSAYAGSYFFGDYVAGFVKRIDASGAVSTFDPLVPDIVDLKVSPNGALYALSIGDLSQPLQGKVYRFTYPTGTNRPPIAGIAAAPNNGTAPLTVALSGLSSSDPDGDALSYTWNFGDGTATKSGASLSHIFQSPGTFTVILTVSDGKGGTGAATVSISVSGVINKPPTGSILKPLAGAYYAAGSTVAYAGAGSDPEDGVLPASALSWTIVFHHDTHTHPFLGPIVGAGGSFVVPRLGETSPNVWYRFHLTVKDSKGMTRETTRDIRPILSTMTVATVPSGLQFILEGQPHTAPLTFKGVTGMTRQLGAPSPQTLNGKTYTFKAWSDGGAATHSLIVPAGQPTYTATFMEAPSAAGLVAAYAMNEGVGATTFDASGRGHTATLSGAVWTTAGKYASALSFNGSSSYASAPSSLTLNLGTTGTLEAWVKLSALGLWHGIVAKGNLNNDQSHNYALEIDNTNHVRCALGNGATSNLLTSAAAVGSGTFMHLACTWDATTIRLYINGVQNAWVSRTVTPTANTSPLFIGQFGGASDFAKGTIDDVRVYNTALPATQIQSDMLTPVKTTSDTQPPTVKITAPTGGSTVSGTVSVTATASDNVGVLGVQFKLDGKVLGAEDTVAPYATSWNTTVVPNGSHVITAVARDAAGHATTASSVTVTVSNTIPQNSLSAAYSFSEGSGSTSADVSGHGNILSLKGAIWTTAGKIGPALSFNGTSAYAVAPAASTLNLGATGTTEVWVKLNVINRWHGLIAKGNLNTDNAHNYSLEVNNLNRAVCVIGNGTSSQTLVSATAVGAGVFIHLACTWDATTLRLYINGVQNASLTRTVTPAANSSPLYIGQFGGPADFTSGTIDEVRIYNIALSGAQILADMTKPATPAFGAADEGGPTLVTPTVAEPVRIQVYPNPWRADRDTGTDIHFTGLGDGNSTVKIFTIAGHLVKEFPASGTTADWNRQTDDGSPAASGIYFYLITDSAGGSHRGKFGVIR